MTPTVLDTPALSKKRPAARVLSTAGIRSSQKTQSMQDRAHARAARAPDLVHDADCNVLLLRRKLLRSAATLSLYMTHVKAFRSQMQICKSPNASVVDTLLELNLNQLFSSGEALQYAVTRYSASSGSMPSLPSFLRSRVLRGGVS